MQLDTDDDGYDIARALHRPVGDLLGCRWPILLAGMGGVAGSDCAPQWLTPVAFVSLAWCASRFR
jgi:hypothetical protein